MKQIRYIELKNILKNHSVEVTSVISEDEKFDNITTLINSTNKGFIFFF